MNWDRIHGHRARIGYTVAAVTTEVYPIDWYRIVPEGVSLMMITLPLGDRSKKDLEKCYAISMESAHTMARAGADLVLLGGLPINISKGDDTVEDLMAGLEKDIGVKMSCSALAQVRAFAALGSKKVVTVHPFLPAYMAEAFRSGQEGVGNAIAGHGIFGHQAVMFVKLL